MDRIFASGLVVLGLIHCALAPLVRGVWNLDTIWFLCGGLAMIFAGMLNFLRASYAEVAPGTRIAALLANVLLLSITIGMGTLLPLRRNPQIVILGVLLALEILMSARQDVVSPS